MSVVPVDDWPLVGRARELARVNAALARPAGSGVLLAGPSGVGKSRLAGECLRRAADHGFHVEHVRATRSSSQIPLGALAPLLPFDNTGEVAGDVLRGVAAAIGASREDGRRLLLAVDDAHLLDDASATVVNHLVTSGRCSVMLTVRTGESAPDPVTALWKDLSVERLDIGPLTPDHVDELLTVVLGGRVDGVTRREFWDASHGNALFVRELLLGAIDSGVLGHDGTIWRLEQRLASPPRLIELIEARLGDLAADERAVVELVALGEPIDVDFLDVAGGATPSLEALEGLARRGLLAVRRVGGARVRQRHDQHRMARAAR